MRQRQIEGVSSWEEGIQRTSMVIRPLELIDYQTLSLCWNLAAKDAAIDLATDGLLSILKVF
jgi:hypothetical protein